MNLKKELPDLIIFKLSMVNKIFSGMSNRLLAEKSIPVQNNQLPVLMYLHYNGNLSQQELANHLNRDKASVQRTIAYLQKFNLVTVLQDADDKRRNVVNLSEEGARTAAAVEEQARLADDHVFSCLTTEERTTLNNLLAKVAMSQNDVPAGIILED
jgi:DNA-binding MarR family transcriptional regulator